MQSLVFREACPSSDPESVATPDLSVSSCAFTDYPTLVAPHVPAVREVLSGQRVQYRFSYEGARFQFHHGCLMGRVFFQNQFFALPPLDVDEEGQPFIVGVTAGKQPWLTEFAALPKGLTLFYFTLLREVFQARPLGYRFQNPEIGELEPAPLPSKLKPILQAVKW